MIVAPHPDDETLGVGGWIALGRRQSIPVSILFLSIGEAAHRQCCGADPSEVAARRRGQAEAAATRLGVEPGDLHWLGLPDGEIPGPADPGFSMSVEKLASVLWQLAPDTIACTHPADGWQDHEHAAQLVQAAIRQAGCGAKLFYYPIWAAYTLPPNRWRSFCQRPWRRLDIGEIRDTKRDALSCYFEAEPAPCGAPWAGRLPWPLVRQGCSRYERVLAAADDLVH